MYNQNHLPVDKIRLSIKIQQNSSHKWQIQDQMLDQTDPPLLQEVF